MAYFITLVLNHWSIRARRSSSSCQAASSIGRAVHSATKPFVRRLHSPDVDLLPASTAALLTLQFEKAEPAAHVCELKIRPTWLQAHALQAIGGRGIAAALRVDLKCALLAGRLTRIVKDPRTRKCYWWKHPARGAHETPSRHAVEI